MVQGGLPVSDKDRSVLPNSQIVLLPVILPDTSGFTVRVAVLEIPLGKAAQPLLSVCAVTEYVVVTAGVTEKL